MTCHTLSTLLKAVHTPIFIDGVAKQGDKSFGSVLLSVCALSALPNAEKSNNPKSTAKLKFVHLKFMLFIATNNSKYVLMFNIFVPNG